MSDFIFLPPSFYLLLRFRPWESTKKINYISLLILESFNLFAGGVSQKFFTPHYNWKVMGRLLGYFTKILQKNFYLTKDTKIEKLTVSLKISFFTVIFFSKNPSIFPRTRVFVLQPLYDIFNELTQKNPCGFGCLYRLVLRTDFNPDYLIFSRFYLKNRTTTKPTPKSLFFNDFNARRGIAAHNYNSMVNGGNYPVRFHKRERLSKTKSCFF